MCRKGDRYPPEVLSREEIRDLLDACARTRSRSTGVRNRALLAVLYRTGMRISEALALRPKDLDHDQGTVRILHGKGDRARTVGMDPKGFEELEAWMLAREKLKGITATSPVFCTLQGQGLTSAYVRGLLPRLASLAKIEKRVHAHGFRHAFASELRREGIDIGVISRQLGHASIATTAHYLDHICPEVVIRTIRARDW